MLSLVAALLLAAPPAVGQQAPDFMVKDTDGKALQLSQLVQKGVVLLAFFPKAFTGGCTAEMQSYTARIQELDQKGARLIAVSTDDLETQKKFKAELGAPFSFVADADAKLTTLFDVKTPVVDYAQRYTFVIGKERKVLRVDEGGAAVDPSTAIQALR